MLKTNKAAAAAGDYDDDDNNISDFKMHHSYRQWKAR